MNKTLAVVIDYIKEGQIDDPLFLAACKKDILDIINVLGLPHAILQSEHIIEELLKESEGFENILIFHANMPLVSLNLSQEVLKRHLEFIVDYTFCEYIPWGFAPFCIQRDVLGKARLLNLKEPYFPLLIENSLKLDLNQYDIEIILADNDYRFIKELFIVTDLRSLALFKDIKESLPPLSSFKEFIHHSIQFFRSYPAFVEVSLLEDAPTKTLFQTPLKKEPQTLNIKDLSSFLTSLSSHNPLATIQFTLQDADPLLHPQIKEVFLLMQHFTSFSFILETLGENLSLYKENILALTNCKLILFIGAVTENTYQKVTEQKDLKKIESLADFFLSKQPHSTYLQWVRMKDNEEELKPFLERWDAYQENIIISQYHSFAGTLKENKVVDFSPLKRFPCFRLAKDLFINASGEIPLCSVDIKSPLPHHHINTLEWKRLLVDMGLLYKQHWEEKYPDLCKKCDLWYISNT